MDSDKPSFRYLILPGILALVLTLFNLYIWVTDDRHQARIQEIPKAENDEVELSEEVQEEVVDWNKAVNNCIADIPNCVKSCVFNRISTFSCAHSDYACLCRTFYKIEDAGIPEGPGAESFSECVKGCENGAQFGLHALPAQILQLCDTLQEPVILPDFMLKTLMLYGRAGSGASSSVVPVPAPTPAPPTTTTVAPSTVTVTPKPSTAILPTSTSTGYSSGDSYTIFFTTTSYTTLLAGETAFTSTQTGAFGLTVYIGVIGTALPTTSKPASSTVSKDTTSASPATATRISSATTPTGSVSTSANNPPRGLSSAAKIGLGVAIPLVFLILGLIVFAVLRRRKASPVSRQGEQVPELPEETSAWKELASGNAGKWQGNGNVIEAAEGQIRGIDQPTAANVHELKADLQPVVHELAPHSVTPKHELAATGFPNEMLNFPQPASSPTAVSRPSNFPAPWDKNAGDNSIYKNPPVFGDQEKDDIREMEEEIKRVREEQERLQRLQDLKTREEELRKTIQARKSGN